MPKWTYIIPVVFFLADINSVIAKEETSPVSAIKTSSHKTVISMTHKQVLSFAKDLIAQGKLDDARKALLVKPYNIRELEIERLYLLAQIATHERKYDEAIEIYRFILDYEPNVANIRFRLAELYLLQEE